MAQKTVTAFDLAQRFVGIKEVAGEIHNPQIMAMLRLDNEWPEGDEVPWCSGFVNYICWLMRLPRSKSLRARSWLNVGRHISLRDAEIGDVVILQRGSGKQPGADVIDAPGHVGFFAGQSSVKYIHLLGGNQNDSVSVARYPASRILGVRRL